MSIALPTPEEMQREVFNANVYNLLNRCHSKLQMYWRRGGPSVPVLIDWYPADVVTEARRQLNESNWQTKVVKRWLRPLTLEIYSKGTTAGV